MAAPAQKRIRLDGDDAGAVDTSTAESTTAPTTELKRKSKPAPPVISIDPDGDLHLCVGSGLVSVQTTDFRVCSAAMRRSSPVFKTMLFGPWKEAKPSQEDKWAVELPEDNPISFQTLLAMIHGRFRDVPKDISLSQLHGILVLVDKYDVADVMRPWIDNWAYVVKNRMFVLATSVVSGHHQHDKSPAEPERPGDKHIMRLHAAWELGLEAVVAEEMVHLVFNLGYHQTQIFYRGRTVALGVHSGPPDLVGKSIDCGPYTIDLQTNILSTEIITDRRLSHLQSILDFYHEQVDIRMEGNSACMERWEDADSDTDLCGSVILGGMWRQLRDTNQNVLQKKAADCSHSVDGLLGTLSTVFRDLSCLTCHEKCSPSEKYAAFEAKVRRDAMCQNGGFAGRLAGMDQRAHEPKVHGPWANLPLFRQNMKKPVQLKPSPATVLFHHWRAPGAFWPIVSSTKTPLVPTRCGA